MQVCCSLECAYIYAKGLRVKKEREETKIAKEKIKSRSEHLKEAQAIFNRFVRERDILEPCISCGRHHKGQYHAGHYRSVGACPELRFEEKNVYKQCSVCNNYLSGNIIEYRKKLVDKYGIGLVEWLEGNHEAKHYSIPDLIEIKKLYRDKLKGLK